MVRLKILSTLYWRNTRDRLELMFKGDIKRLAYHYENKRRTVPYGAVLLFRINREIMNYLFTIDI